MPLQRVHFVPRIDPLFLFMVATAMVLVVVACGGKSEPQPSPPSAPLAATCPTRDGLSRLEPEEGTYFGVNLDWGKDTPSAYASRLGKKPAVYVAFAPFPLDSAAGGYLDKIVSDVAKFDGALMLTLEPNGGLETVNDGAINSLVSKLSSYNDQGVPVYLRFAHEMNGSWYAWSQQPAEYITAYRRLAAAVHSRAPRTAMVWAPNYGGGYPFTGGTYAALPGTPNFQVLDTNKDGRLTMADDPYTPYYPGDDAVDWVGMSLYHWGSAYPWGENERPEAGKLVQQLTGEYNGFGGDDRPLPDFYASFARDRKKPVAITETAAFYAPGAGGENEQSIKQQWWQQVLSQSLHTDFPMLKMINWFEWAKYETEVKAQVDWTVTRNASMEAAFKQDLPPHFLYASDSQKCP